MHGFHPHFQATVIKQQGVAGAHITRQLLVVQPDALGATFLALRIEDEGGPFGQHHGTFGKFADTNLRPLQIGQQADDLALPGSRLAHCTGPCQMVLGRTMREIHADDVNARRHHTLQHFRRRGGWAKRGDDFGMTTHAAPFNCWSCWQKGKHAGENGLPSVPAATPG